jgi:hypothetical protein
MDHKPNWNSSVPTDSYHTSTRLLDATKGMIVDPGSVYNLAGDHWAADVGRDAAKAGRRPKQVKRDRTLRVSGVGEGSQAAQYDIKLPCCFERTDGSYSSGTFDTPCVSNSQLPGLLGLNSLEGNRGLIDFITGKMYFLGPGDYNLDSVLPPGTECFQLRKAPSGHLVLPCNHYDAFDKKQASGALVMDQVPRSLLTQEHREPEANPKSKPKPDVVE